MTAAEALAVGLPALFVRPIPGHEERNQAVLVGTGAARAVPPAESIARAVSQLLAQPERLRAMREAALRAGAPQAAERVVELMAHGAGRWSPRLRSMVG